MADRDRLRVHVHDRPSHPGEIIPSDWDAEEEADQNCCTYTCTLHQGEVFGPPHTYTHTLTHAHTCTLHRPIFFFFKVDAFPRICAFPQTCKQLWKGFHSLVWKTQPSVNIWEYILNVFPRKSFCFRLSGKKVRDDSQRISETMYQMYQVFLFFPPSSFPFSLIRK